MRRIPEVLGWERTSTPLHGERLDAVVGHLVTDGVETVLDLGCGSGALLERLLSIPHLRRIVGVDRSAYALLQAEGRLVFDDGGSDPRLSLREASITSLPADLAGFDAAALVETLEHLHPGQLSILEQGVFQRLRPGRVVMTTPNREYNEILGLAPGEVRHPDHRFEWDRARFQRWAEGVARRNGYSVTFAGVGPGNAWFGNATQMAEFQRDPD